MPAGATPSRDHCVRGDLDFLIAGVQKGGTTALNALLRQGPHTCSTDLELGLMPKVDCQRLNATCACPTSRKCLVGTHAPASIFNQLTHQQYGREIRIALPKLKVIILLREPMQRAYSAYQMFRSWHGVPGYKATAFTAVVATWHQRLLEAVTYGHAYGPTPAARSSNRSISTARDANWTFLAESGQLANRLRPEQYFGMVGFGLCVPPA